MKSRWTSRRYNRRRFLQQSSMAISATTIARPLSLVASSPNERVNLAAVGVGGKGWTDISQAAEGQNVVAFCDVETGKIKRRGGFAGAAEKWPRASRYQDWRKMLEKEASHLDGVTISTPDHMHAPITMTAMRMGLAVYTQKPLTRTIHEARQLTLAAAQTKVATQMGNQHHNGSGYLTLVELIQSGAVGKIREAHAWSNRPIWPQGIKRPRRNDEIPKSLDWDLWLGVAPKRPYASETYHPFKWRGWYDFGAGALGDMGCHIIDPVVWALDLGPANWCSYDGPAPTPETFPAWEIIRYEFPGTKYTTGKLLPMTWYDGGKMPSAADANLPSGESLPSNGTLFIGENGTIVTPHGGMPRLLPDEKFRDFDMPKIASRNHYQQWIAAIRGETSTSSGFDYAGPLTETVLLGTVAPRFPHQKLMWDVKKLQFSNVPDANSYVRQEYRKGWEVDGLSG